VGQSKDWMEAGETEAVALAQAGDDEAFGALVERHSRAVFRLAFRMTGNEQDAEDVVQETFLNAYRRLRRFELRSSFGTWVHRIAVNCSLDLIRARQREAERRRPAEAAPGRDLLSVPAGDPTPERRALSAELRQRLEAALGELSPMERAAFVMRHLEGLSIDEIGRMLGRRPDAAKNCVFRAVQKIRRALEPSMSSIR